MRTLKLAFRTLAKAPIVTSVAILSLALDNAGEILLLTELGEVRRLQLLG